MCIRDRVDKNSGSHPHPVATPPKKGGPKHPWGLHDLHGNVWEWCTDPWEDNYNRWKGGRRHDPAEEPGTGDPASPRVIRGGSWSVGPRDARSAYRFGRLPDGRGGDLGFRLLRLLPES